MKKANAVIGAIFAMAVINFSETSTNAVESSVNIFVWAVTGPVRANPSAFELWAPGVVQEVYTNGAPSGAIDYRLKTEYIAQPTPAQNSNTLWFVVRVVAKDPAFKFLPSGLRFVGKSSNGNNLTTVTSMAGDAYVYSPKLMGVTWNGAPRSADTVVSGKIADMAVNEVIFIGAQSTYFTYGTQSVLDAINNFVMGAANFSVTGTWSLVDASGNTLASASKTLEAKGTPVSPTISITRSGATVSLGVDLPADRSATIYSSPTLPAISWRAEATVNTGDVISRSPTGNMFFKAGLQ